MVPVSLGQLARQVWVPAYSTGIVLALALGAARLGAELDSVAAVVRVGTLGVVGYWPAFYAIWLGPDERRLVRGLLPGGA